MKKQILIAILIFCVGSIIAQPVEVDIFQKTATASTSQIGVRVRATGANVDYIGVTFYILYQSANAVPQSLSLNSVVGVDDSKMVTTFGWGTSARFTNPAQIVSIDPGSPGGQVYNRRYVYGNIDENGGTNIITVTTTWDTLLLITLNTLQPVYPQGGFAYQQSTSEAAGTALSDPGFANISFTVNSGDKPLGLNTVPITFLNFDTKCTDKGVALSWITNQEQNTSKFEIQKSDNGLNWKTVGVVTAAGNSNTEKKYTYFDNSTAGTNFLYRIMEIDISGKLYYSKINRTECGIDFVSEIKVWPNPTANIMYAEIMSENISTVNIKMIDGKGAVCLIKNEKIIKGKNIVKMDLAKLATGVYYATFNWGDGVHQQVKKIIKD